MNFEEKLSKGFELLKEKDIDHALDIARELQKEDPESDEAFYLEALVMQQLNQWDIGLKSVEKALELVDDNAAYFNLRGNILMQQEKLDKAEEDFDKVERLNLRFVIDGIDELFAEYRDQELFHDRTDLRNTPWGTREFAFYDLDGNGLTFYRDL